MVLHMNDAACQRLHLDHLEDENHLNMLKKCQVASNYQGKQTCLLHQGSGDCVTVQGGALSYYSSESTEEVKDDPKENNLKIMLPVTFINTGLLIDEISQY